MKDSTASTGLLAATLLTCATSLGTTWYVSPDGTGDTVTAATPCEAFGLRATSPCRDSGLTLSGQSAETDVLGNPLARRSDIDCRVGGRGFHVAALS